MRGSLAVSAMRDWDDHLSFWFIVSRLFSVVHTFYEHAQ